MKDPDERWRWLGRVLQWNSWVYFGDGNDRTYGWLRPLLRWGTWERSMLGCRGGQPSTPDLDKMNLRSVWPYTWRGYRGSCKGGEKRNKSQVLSAEEFQHWEVQKRGRSLPPSLPPPKLARDGQKSLCHRSQEGTSQVRESDQPFWMLLMAWVR